MTLDPYRDWLSIQGPARPLNHYQLLGLKPSEQDAGQIQAAYARCMGLVRRYQVGAHMDLAQRLISELSEAYATLTHPQQRQVYDLALRGGETKPHTKTVTESVAAPSPPTPQTPIEPVAAAPSESLRLVREPQRDVEQYAPTSESADEPKSPKSRPSSKRLPLPLIASSIAGLALILGLLLWVPDGDAPPPPVPRPRAGARTIVKPSFPSPPPPTATRTEASQRNPDTLESWLAQAPRMYSPVDLSAVVQAIAEGEITVTAKPGDLRTVRVTFADAPVILFQQLEYRPGARVQIMGVVQPDVGHNLPWRIEGHHLWRVGVPGSRINAAVISNARMAIAATAASTQSPTNVGRTPPRSMPRTIPSSTPLSPWDQQLYDAENEWNKLRDGKLGDRLALSATFVGFEPRSPLPPELRLRLRLNTITLKGPFPPRGTEFLQQLKTDDRLDLEVTLVDNSRFPKGVALNWIARAGAAAAERVACRPVSTTSLVQSIAVNPNRPINSLAWSPDGSKVAVAAQPATLWDASTGELLAILSSQECVQATWTSDGLHIALVEGSLAGASLDRIVICDLTGKVFTAYPTRANKGLLVASNPTQPQMAVVAKNPASSGAQMAVGLINFASKPANQALGEFIGTPRVAWSSDGTRLALAARDSSFRGIRIAKLNARNLLTKVEDVAFEGLVSDLRWVPGSDLLGVHTINDLTVGDPLNAARAPLKIDSVFGSRKYAFSADGRLVAAIRVLGNLQVWGVEAAAAPQWDDDPSRLDSVVWSPTRPHVAAMETSGAIWMWNASGLRLTRIHTGVTAFSSDQETVLAFSPDGNRLATVGLNKVLIYDVSQAEGE